jgi:hypothetical protein
LQIMELKTERPAKIKTPKSKPVAFFHNVEIDERID